MTESDLLNIDVTPKMSSSIGPLSGSKLTAKPASKTIKDCLYGQIVVPPLCVAFMDVPEFQRLRRVRQLGVAHYAYPSAAHSRFEHCLGVMHLAGKLVDQLRNFVTISDRTKELIQLAAMYHDIGHLAFSHLFDLFLSHLSPEEELPEFFLLHEHEDRSLYFVHKVNARLKLLSPDEEQFVCDAIRGNVPPKQPSYLYEIVCNRECGLDQDRMDYIYRDAFHIGLPAFQSDYIRFCTVIDRAQHIAYKNKAYEDIKDLFDVRRRMHEKVYQHRTTLKVNKICFCMMRRLGAKLYMYGEHTDDYNIETLFRISPETSELVQALDNRELEHDCEICHDYQPIRMIKQSGCIENVRFV